MNNNPTVTILTATYNQEAYIHECIDSVIAQTYPYWHLYILDDGSTDDTVSIADEYAKGDPRIRVLGFAHTGMAELAKRYNSALALSVDEFVAILDGDDYWPSDKLYVQVKAHKELDVAITFGNGIEVINAKHLEFFNSRKRSLLIQPSPSGLLIPLLRAEFAIPAVTVMARRGDLNRIGGFKQPKYLPVCDFPTWLHMGMYGIAYIDHVLGYWRHSSTQTTWTQSRQVVYGAYQYSQTFASAQNLMVPLMPKSRSRILADASYRQAVLLWKSNDYPEAYKSIREVFLFRKFQNIDKFITFFLMIIWNKLKTLINKP